MFFGRKIPRVRIFRRTDAFLYLYEYLDRLKLFFQASSGVTTSLENEFVRVIRILYRCAQKCPAARVVVAAKN